MGEKTCKECGQAIKKTDNDISDNADLEVWQTLMPVRVVSSPSLEP